MSAKTVNKLHRKESRKLEDFIVEHQEKIEKGSFTITTFSDYAKKTLGFQVTPGNVQGAAEAMDVHFCANGQRGKALVNINQLRKAVVIIAQEIADMKGQLGITVSPILQEIAKQIDAEDQQ